MNSAMRQQVALIEAEGVVIESSRAAKSHVVAYCRAPSGARFCLVLQNSALADRAARNFRAQIRRRARGLAY